MQQKRQARSWYLAVKVVIMTREYPPHVYGGAGVHVEYLCRELARMATVEVKCFGDQRLDFGNPAAKGGNG